MNDRFGGPFYGGRPKPCLNGLSMPCEFVTYHSDSAPTIQFACCKILITCSIVHDINGLVL